MFIARKAICCKIFSENALTETNSRKRRTEKEKGEKE